MRTSVLVLSCLALTAAALMGCDGSDPGTNPEDGPAAGNPDGKCDVPDEAKAEDTSNPTTVVGDGSLTARRLVELHLRQLRAAGRPTPILFLTGHSQPIYEEAALVQGAVDFIDKSRSFAIISTGNPAMAGCVGAGPVAATVTGLAFDSEPTRTFADGTRSTCASSQTGQRTICDSVWRA